ncbi:MAG: hypothetical protein E7033_04220 [Akkermansiaceae bacterium]|nr:hypothetical protein [Akkermansiaceae bacterium]
MLRIPNPGHRKVGSWKLEVGSWKLKVGSFLLGGAFGGREGLVLKIIRHGGGGRLCFLGFLDAAFGFFKSIALLRFFVHHLHNSAGLVGGKCFIIPQI